MNIETSINKTRMDFRTVVMAYLEVTKPRSVVLLVFTALATMVVASAMYGPVAMSQLITATAAVTLACAGANAVSCYIDRDLDASMTRTQKRPIPDGRINPPVRALYWGLLLFVSSLFLGWRVNPVAFACLWGGMIGYVGIYSLWLKRRSSWNIILGGFSGGLPALFGWTAVTGKVDLLPLLIAALVVLWIPNHIWSLAIFYKEDYARVKVPMLPVVCEARKALHCLISTVILMVACSLLIYFAGSWGTIYLATAIITGLAAIGLSTYVYLRPARQNAWLLFKFSSPYLFLLFLGMMLDTWL
ncbi:protoheme IX farnesyltransferase [Desulfofundulus australicus DSM 11792]|uniref:Protoheme IX farnesyltransferase n=1 Tax=Desulfofundulus australicus DSM 11792 TaxID=1121425 RepID=A0A1M4ZIW1_9FIRM|nr:heme o synthase [Desulfofundulus australicus]SHF17973.1 protoheme IX farnesyltransferase [Desulfofundulus australicus DSM 11792]